MEFVLQGAKDFGDTLDMDEPTVVLKNLEETAHVRALELVGEIHGEGHGGHGVLGGAGTVADDDGIAEALYAYLVDPEVTEVRGGLGVVEFSLP